MPITVKKKKQVLRPGSTKTSIKRQLQATEKRLQKLSLVPNEVLYSVFKYLKVSDLLRCCCVSKHWYDVANLPALWDEQFKRQPDKIKKLSKKFQTCQEVDWKEEIIKCGLKRRKMKLESFSKRVKKNSLGPTLHMQILEATAARSLQKKTLEYFTSHNNVKWCITLLNNKGEITNVYADDHFGFEHGITIRWNSLTDVSLKDVKYLQLHACTVVFYDDSGIPVKQSVRTKSQMYRHDFKGDSWKKLKCVISDDENITIYSLHEYIYIGVWNSTLTGNADIAFFTMTSPLTNLLSKVTNGKSQKLALLPGHVPKPCDVDPTYGMHGYSCSLEMRNSRKSFHSISQLEEFETGYFDGDDKLVICYNRPIDYNFYDIKDNFNFTWKTVALKGIIKNSIILDMVLYDFNHDVIWTFSSICKVEKLSNESDNYQYDNYELWRIKYEENDKTCIVEIIKNGDSHQGNESTIKSINFHIKRNLINQWFATNYTA